jgi:hypothetical protein
MPVKQSSGIATFASSLTPDAELNWNALASCCLVADSVSLVRGDVQEGLAGIKLFCLTLPFSKFGIRKPTRINRRLFA